MRLLLSLLVVSVAGLSFAQDTNFPAGPQYLVTSGSPMFLQSIATPSLSLNAPMPDPYISQTQLAATAISEAHPAAPDTFSPNVFWGEDRPVTPRVATPSLTPEQTTFYTYGTANQPLSTESVATPESVEVPEGSSVIEITSARTPDNLPVSIFNPGVSENANPQWLLIHGYGMSLGEIARYWKLHKQPAMHVLTNEGLQRR